MNGILIITYFKSAPAARVAVEAMFDAASSGCGRCLSADVGLLPARDFDGNR
jgi:hypothetical protein